MNHFTQPPARTDEKELERSASRARRTYTVAEAAEILGISVNSAYEAVRRGEIPSIRLGHRVVVPRKAFDRFVDGLAAGQDDVA
jgi:excisionase family DNA binding protein